MMQNGRMIIPADFIQLWHEKVFQKPSQTGKVLFIITHWQYYTRTGENIEEVIERAKKAITSIGKKFGVIVGDCTNLKWSGLSVREENCPGATGLSRPLTPKMINPCQSRP